jgi:hypothetical protein
MCSSLAIVSLSKTWLTDLDVPHIISQVGITEMDGYSTREAAKKLGLALSSLTKYISLKQIPVPPLTRVGGVRVRLWSDKDIQEAQLVLPKVANGRKTRHQKPGKKQTTRKPKR